MYPLFFYFSFLILAFIGSGFSFLGENDDWVLWYFLKNGENVTLVLSYPLSSLLCYLYKIFPNGDWYSFMILSYLLLIALLASYHISKIDDKKLRFWAIILTSLIFIHFLMNVTVTELTLLLIIFSLPFIYENQLIFWILLFIASFLRVQIIFNLLPIFAIAYLILARKKSILKESLFVIPFIAIGIIYISSLSSIKGEDYKRWLEFSKARAYFMDLHGKDNKNILNDDEKFVNHTWWAQDEEILPTSKVIKAANSSSLNIIKNAYMDLNLNKIAKIFIKHKLIIFLIFLTFYLIFKEREISKKILYFALMAAIMTLIIARDMERVSYPLLILWAFLIFFRLYLYDKKDLLMNLLKVSALILLLESTLTRIYNHQTKEELKKEAIELMAKHPFVYELSLGCPTEYGILSMVAIQDHLFFEKDWFSLKKNRVLLSGWISRHPFFYKTHKISFDGYRGKYDNFYQFLIDENTAFIGSLKISDKAKRILKIYDKKFAKKVCHHKIIFVDKSKHFSITKIVKECDI